MEASPSSLFSYYLLIVVHEDRSCGVPMRTPHDDFYGVNQYYQAINRVVVVPAVGSR